MSRPLLIRRYFSVRVKFLSRSNWPRDLFLTRVVPSRIAQPRLLTTITLLLLFLNASPLLAIVNLDLLEQAVVAGNELLAALHRTYSVEAIAAAERFETALREMALKGLDLPPDRCNAAAADLLADGLILTTAIRERQSAPPQAQKELIRRIAQVGQICGVQ